MGATVEDWRGMLWNGKARQSGSVLDGTGAYGQRAARQSRSVKEWPGLAVAGMDGFGSAVKDRIGEERTGTYRSVPVWHGVAVKERPGTESNGPDGNVVAGQSGLGPEWIG